MGSVGQAGKNKYIRFGQIPEGGRSVNYMALSNDQNEDFTYALRMGDSVMDALQSATGGNAERFLESGVSVFKMDSDGLPKIENLAQATSLSARLDDDIYVITGSQVGVGQDDEPTVSVSRFDSANISRARLVKKIESVLSKNYGVVKPSPNPSQSAASTITEHAYWHYGNGTPRYPDGTEYVVFNGKEYSKPKNGWKSTRDVYAARRR